MKLVKIMATMAIAGGLAAGAGAASTGIANADPGPSVGPVSAWGSLPQERWHGDGNDWRGHDGRGPDWGGPGWRGDPIPGGWNGGWEPWGGVCIFGLCA
jgi:hypothetical protein